MKKRALILAIIAFIATTTSEPSINMVRAEETQVEDTGRRNTDRGKCRSDIRTAYKDTYTEGYGCESLYGSK